MGNNDDPADTRLSTQGLDAMVEGHDKKLATKLLADVEDASVSKHGIKPDLAAKLYYQLQWAVFIVFLLLTGFTGGVIFTERVQSETLKTWFQAYESTVHHQTVKVSPKPKPSSMRSKSEAQPTPPK